MSKYSTIEVMPLNKSVCNRLMAMEGGYYTYAKQVHLIKSVTIDDDQEKITIDTDLRRYDRKFDSVESFLGYWTKAETPEKVKIMNKSVNGNEVAVAIDPEVVTLVQNTATETTDLVKILKENIENVRTNKEYIQQANAINASVNTIINLRKTQLEIIKASKGLKK